MNLNTIYSPNGSEIWMPQMDMNGELLVYDALTYTLKNTIAVGMMPAELTFSSDGTKAYAANGNDNTVLAIITAAKQVTAAIAVGDNPVGAWAGSDARMYVDNLQQMEIQPMSPIRPPIQPLSLMHQTIRSLKRLMSVENPTDWR